MTTTVRPAIAADYSAVERLAREILVYHATALPDTFRVVDPALPESRFRDLITDASSIVLVAEHAETIAGYIECRLLPASANPAQTPHARAIIETIVVAAEMRGQGIGQTLFTACTHWAKNRGADALLLEVWEFNAGAIAFYARLGMATIHRRMSLPLD
jgi:ribosomal protein S18 acetylase RimI-like enzyme